MGQQISCGIKVGDHSFFWGVECNLEQSPGCCGNVMPYESFCGSDAFYRDAFVEGELDVRDGSRSIAARVREQARLKAMKGEVFVKTLATSTRRSAKTGTLNSEVSQFVAGKLAMVRQGSTLSDGTVLTQRNGHSWLGTTVDEYVGEGLREPLQGACWKKGDGCGIPLRAPNYLRTKATVKSEGHMYGVTSVDGFKSVSGDKIEEIMGRVVDKLPPPKSGSTWTHDCGLPRVICINVMLPYYNPKNPWAKDDGGCSWVVFCEIEDSTLESLRGDSPVPPCVRLFQKFCEGPVGRPGGAKDDKNRNLGTRRGPTSKDRDTGIFKAIGWCENEDELGIPDYLRKFNGQNFVVTDSGYVIKDPKGEWLEMGFDVRVFPLLFREVLFQFGDLVPKGQYHCGFVIQATEDEYLPEGLICDMFVSGIDLKATPVAFDLETN